MKKIYVFLSMILMFAGCEQKNSTSKEKEVADSTYYGYIHDIVPLKDIPKTAAGIVYPMVYVEGGSYMVGGGKRDRRPKHTVSVNSFYIGKYEVANGLWNRIMPEEHSVAIADELPVGGVTRTGAILFCNALSKMEGLEAYYNIEIVKRERVEPSDEEIPTHTFYILKENADFGILDKHSESEKVITINPAANGYRLPTEAERVFAARGGNLSKGYTYAGSDSLDEVAWYRENTPTENLKRQRPMPIGQKKPNELGLYDMNGNVDEWCWDWKYDSDLRKENRVYYQQDTIFNPLGPPVGKDFYLTGGCFNAYKEYCEIDYYNYRLWTSYLFFVFPTYGFRVVRNAP